MSDVNIEEDSVRILVDCLNAYDINNRFASSISMVPSVLRDVSPDSYNPRVVSIGPLHYQDESLRAGEQLKLTYVRNLFDHLPCNIEPTLEECLRKVNESIHKIKECYVGMRHYSTPELARMMVVDCCYILAFLSSERTENSLLACELSRDLLLLENQIPFFILKDIFELTISKYRPTTSSLISDLISSILHYGNFMIFKGDITITNALAYADDHDHILGLLHKCYKPESNIRLRHTPFSVCNVVELEKAGVSFRPNQDVSWPLAIEIEYSRFKCFPFWVKPTLKMPRLLIHDQTEWFLRNIIAYEQTSKVDQYFSSFAKAIDDLVDNGQDIAKLEDSKVLINYLGSNKEAALMLNNIGKNVIASSFYFKEFKELDTYYNKSWPNNIAWLRRTYFNNPWNIVALVAGIILFALTIVQTIFTAIQTYFTVYPKN